MKKVLTAVASLSLLLAACGSDSVGNVKTEESNNKGGSDQTVGTVIAGSPIQDGVYKLQEVDFDDKGWKASMEIVVENGKIIESDYNYENADGILKTEDEGYQKLMEEKVGIGPQQYIPKLNNSLVSTQNADSVDIVSGATHSAETFKNYAQQLIQAAQAGDSATIEIANNKPLQDGNYSLEEKNIGATGWRTFLKMTVNEGKIVATEYDYVNEAADLKTKDNEYQQNMKDKTGVGPQEFVPELSNALMEKQNAEDIDVVAGATHSSHTFKMYAAQLINAAQKGDTTPILIDNFVFEK
ncbi:extracellular electron transfer flavoprotein PplA [Lederbergia graminis]|uniref:Extracellular electron transfer flavoprotein PplA n=1 Tax=Lederbergia graminis TaxID=735518 RepID=A0ABW0LG11_9BACI